MQRLQHRNPNNRHNDEFCEYAQKHRCQYNIKIKNQAFIFFTLILNLVHIFFFAPKSVAVNTFYGIL